MIQYSSLYVFMEKNMQKVAFVVYLRYHVFCIIKILSVWFIKCQTFLYFADYDDVPVKDVSSKLPIFSDMLKRGTSFNWSETGQQSFRIMKKKLQEATWQY